MYKIFIDGAEGTTGLRIYERLSVRKELQLIKLPEEERKNPERRAEALNSCDIAFLCLPDAAAREAVAMVENTDVRIIDASTAHRTAPDWAYGFPELSDEHRANIAKAKRVSVPGCHASGFVSLTAPLVAAGILPGDAKLCCHSLTGFSGGGKRMIAQYQDRDREWQFDAPRQYALSQGHKHLPEMAVRTGLASAPVFCPIVADYYSGMLVTVPLFSDQLCKGKTVLDIAQAYSELYNGPIVSFTGIEGFEENGFACAISLSGTDLMQVTVAGNDERILLMSRFDNLGKGASGAAVQCMNIMLGLDQTTGLELEM